MARIENQHTYSLKNCYGDTAVDLSGDDNYSIIGYHPHDGSNQAWIFQQDGDQNGWFIKSSRSGKYLGIEGSPNEGAAVVVVSVPFKWDVKDSDVENTKGIRILAHGTNFSLNLDHGNSANYTKIQLWGSQPGANQIWALTKRVSIEDNHTYSLRNRQGGTVVDLSGHDNHSIIGHYSHDGSNQAWIFQRDGDQNGWFIKSSCSGQYLGIEGDAYNGTRVVAVPSPFKWDVKISDVEGVDGIRILIHGTNYSLDLSDYGNSANNTKVQIWRSWAGANQIWGLIERL
jgi:hypothetical protein